MIKLLFTLFMMACLGNAFAQNPPDYPGFKAVISGEDSASWPLSEGGWVHDSTLYHSSLNIDRDSVRSWKRSRDFMYMRDLDSLLAASQKQIADVPLSGGSRHSFLDNLFAGSWFTILLWILGGLFVVFILYKLFFTKGVFVRAERDANVHEEEPTDAESIERDFSGLAAAASAEGDYRLAVRYLFLRCLQKLNEQGLIEYATGKTNARYQQELPAEKKVGFASVALSYEYAWYGNNSLDKDAYNKIEAAYSSFLNNL